MERPGARRARVRRERHSGHHGVPAAHRRAKHARGRHLSRRRYRALASNHEGRQVASYLNSLGIAAFVLRYRLGPALSPSDRARRRAARDPPGALARRGLAHRSRARRHRGVFGRRTSGDDGEHAIRRRRTRRGRRGGSGEQPARLRRARLPGDFDDGRWTHKGSRTNLLGENPDPELAKSLSGERAVTKDTPPTFLFQTSEDTTVPAENSVHYYLALRKAGVPAEMHVFEKGPHGVGLANDDAALSEWSKLLANWLRGRKLIK